MTNAKILYIEKETYDTIQKVLTIYDFEFQWFFETIKYNNNLLIKNVFLIPKQEGTSSTINSSYSNIEELMSLCATKGVNSLNTWCHSHVNMPCNPSSQDYKTVDEYMEFGYPFFIMLIYNKQKEYSGQYFTKTIDGEIVSFSINLSIIPQENNSVIEEFKHNVTKKKIITDAWSDWGKQFESIKHYEGSLKQSVKNQDKKKDKGLYTECEKDLENTLGRKPTAKEISEYLSFIENFK